MYPLLANYVTTMTDFTQQPEIVLEQVETATVAILENNQPRAYLVSAADYEELLERLEDYELSLLVKAREPEKSQAIEVSLDDL
jgi:antitoxin StbD